MNVSKEDAFFYGSAAAAVGLYAMFYYLGFKINRCLNKVTADTPVGEPKVVNA